MEKEHYAPGPSSHSVVASAGAWTRRHSSDHVLLVICTMRLAKLPQSVSLSGLFWGTVRMICSRQLNKQLLAAPSPTFSPARWVLLSQVDPSGRWATVFRVPVGGPRPTHTPLLFQILGSKRLRVESRRGSFDKPAFFMEKINISRVIFLSQEEINL